MRGFSVTDGNGCHFRGLQCCLEVLIRSWSCIWKVGGSPKEVAVIERRCQERDRRCSCGSDKWPKLYQGEDLASVTIRADSPSVIGPGRIQCLPMTIQCLPTHITIDRPRTVYEQIIGHLLSCNVLRASHYHRVEQHR